MRTAATFRRLLVAVHAVAIASAVPRDARAEGAASTRAIEFGYYAVDGRHGDHHDAVAGYTNIDHISLDQYPVSVHDPNTWRPMLDRSMSEAVRRGKGIVLSFALHRNASIPEILDVAAPYWHAVRRVELADEPDWDRDTTQYIAGWAKSAIAARGLPSVPLGAVYPRDEILGGDAFRAEGLDWVGVECYVDAPGMGSRWANVDEMDRVTYNLKHSVPGDKDLVLVMMAYDRNGHWKDIDSLAAMQASAYESAYDDPRVVGITMFAYGRPGGARDYEVLREQHRAIGKKIGPLPPPAIPGGEPEAATEVAETPLAEPAQSEGEVVPPAPVEGVVDAAAAEPPSPEAASPVSSARVEWLTPEAEPATVKASESADEKGDSTPARDTCAEEWVDMGPMDLSVSPAESCRLWRDGNPEIRKCKVSGDHQWIALAPVDCPSGVPTP